MLRDWEKHNKERVKDLKYKIRRMDKGKDRKLLEREVEKVETVYLAKHKKYDTSTWYRFILWKRSRTQNKIPN